MRNLLYFSQLLMPPYATGRKEGERPYEPATIDYMMAVSDKMSEAMESCHGVPYRVGQSRDVDRPLRLRALWSTLIDSARRHSSSVRSARSLYNWLYWRNSQTIDVGRRLGFYDYVDVRSVP